MIAKIAVCMLLAIGVLFAATKGIESDLFTGFFAGAVLAALATGKANRGGLK